MDKPAYGPTLILHKGRPITATDPRVNRIFWCTVVGVILIIVAIVAALSNGSKESRPIPADRKVAQGSSVFA